MDIPTIGPLTGWSAGETVNSVVRPLTMLECEVRLLSAHFCQPKEEGGAQT